MFRPPAGQQPTSRALRGEPPLAGEASSDVLSPLTTAAAETTSPKPCAATGVSRDDPTTAARAAPSQKKAPRWSAGRRAPLRISLRRGRDAEGGCRARSAEGGDADCVARNLPSASRRSAPVAFGEQFVLAHGHVRPRQHSSGAHASRERLVMSCRRRSRLLLPARGEKDGLRGRYRLAGNFLRRSDSRRRPLTPPSPRTRGEGAARVNDCASPHGPYIRTP